VALDPIPDVMLNEEVPYLYDASVNFSAADIDIDTITYSAILQGAEAAATAVIVESATATKSSADATAQQASDTLTAAQASIVAAQSTLDTANTNLQTATDALSVATDAQAAATAGGDADTISAADQALIDAQAAYDQAVLDAQTATDTLATANTNTTQAETDKATADASATQAATSLATAIDNQAQADAAALEVAKVDGTGLPDWLSINSATGVLSGTPMFDDSGLFNVTVTATDLTGIGAADTFSIKVNDVVYGSDYDDEFSVTDPTILYGGKGEDTLILDGNYADYNITQSDAFVTIVTDARADAPTFEQTVSLHSIEKIQFADALAIVSHINGGEFHVNTYITGSQSNPSSALLSSGGFVTTWQSNHQDGDSYGIFAQLFDTGGHKVGNEFLVNTHTPDYQVNAKVAALNEGGFVITWQSNNQDGSGYGIFAQLFDADGSVLNAEFQVNTHTDYAQSDPDITTLDVCHHLAV